MISCLSCSPDPQRYSTFECCLLGLLFNNNNNLLTKNLCQTSRNTFITHARARAHTRISRYKLSSYLKYARAHVRKFTQTNTHSELYTNKHKHYIYIYILGFGCPVLVPSEIREVECLLSKRSAVSSKITFPIS